MRESQKYLALQILKLLSTGVLFTAVSILSPTFLYSVIRQYLKLKLHEPYEREKIRKAVDYLKRKQFIAYPAKSKRKYIFLTKKGRQHLLMLKIKELTIKKTGWDKRWRVVTFDIPESDTPDRFRFRRMLKQLGFFHFQRSVFVLPYPCEKEVKLISQYLKIEPYVHVLTAGRFANDQALVRYYKLK